MATLQMEPKTKKREAWNSHAVSFGYDDDAVEREPSAGMLEALEDVRLRRNIYGPFATVEEAMRSMLED